MNASFTLFSYIICTGMWANWSSCHLIGHRWGRWKMSHCYSWTATLCVSSARLDPPFWATNKVVISSWSLFLRLEWWPFAHKYSIFPDTLDIPLASVKRLVHMVEILWEYSKFISLRKCTWSRSWVHQFEKVHHWGGVLIGEEMQVSIGPIHERSNPFVTRQNYKQ